MISYSEHNIARAIYLALKDKTHTEQPAILKNTVGFLAKKKLLSKSSKILSHLANIEQEDKGVLVAKVWSAEPMSESAKKHLTHALLRRYGGQHVVRQEHQDPSVVGGYRIEVGDEVMDLTLRNRLKQLQEHLVKSAQ